MEVGALFTIIGCCLALISLLFVMFIFLATKMDGIRSDISSLSKEVHLEMKDFHGRLERQDSEFKHGMLRLEEKFHLNSIK